jgi:probable selenium-dependent hydroxylase accessory protein YqeC
LETAENDLVSALDIGQREHIALVGGGGKTTLMFTLAGELLKAGQKVITTTTTKIRRQEATRAPCEVSALSDPAWHQKVKQGLKIHGHVFMARRPLDSGKVEGISPELADRLYLYPIADHIIVEADGAAGKPVKAPAKYEPVVPSKATLVIAMLGLEAMEKPFDERIVFRPSLFEKLTGLGRGETITGDCLIKIFESPEGLYKGAPVSARRIAFLNKADLLTDNQIAKDLAVRILLSRAASVDRVVIGSIAKKEYLLISKKDERNISENC